MLRKIAVTIVITLLAVDAWDLIGMRHGHRPPPWASVKDFTGFYIGAKMLGTPYLYDIQTNLDMQRRLTGATNPGIIYVRPPFWAWFMRPLAALPYRVALRAWKAISVVGLMVFALIDTYPKRAAIALLCSYPLHVALSIYQDSPLILFWIGLSLWAWRTKRPWLAGAALAMCIPKFHMLVFLPLLLFRKKYREALLGFAAVAAVLFAINFFVQPDWIRLYARALMMPTENMNGRPGLMPNFYAVFGWTGHPAVAFALGAIVMTILVWRICRLYPFEMAMPLCIVGAILASWHSNDSDSLLAIPACLALYEACPQLRLFLIVLLSPFATVMMSNGPPYLGPAVFVIPMAWLMVHVAATSRVKNVAQPDQHFAPLDLSATGSA